jgi:hypothetical protein
MSKTWKGDRSIIWAETGSQCGEEHFVAASGEGEPPVRRKSSFPRVLPTKISDGQKCIKTTANASSKLNLPVTHGNIFWVKSFSRLHNLSGSRMRRITAPQLFEIHGGRKHTTRNSHQLVAQFDARNDERFDQSRN